MSCPALDVTFPKTDSQPSLLAPASQAAMSVSSDSPSSTCWDGFEGPEKRLQLDFASAAAMAACGSSSDTPYGLLSALALDRVSSTSPSPEKTKQQEAAAAAAVVVDASSSSPTLGASRAARTRGLRAIPRQRWDELLELAGCNIISERHTDAMDAYVLSESSLFVYPSKMMIKTCGTTTLLDLIPGVLQDAAELCGLAMSRVLYSHRNFNCAAAQKGVYRSWADEVAQLNDYFAGTAHVLGDSCGDHFCLYHYAVNQGVVSPGESPDSSMDEDAGLDSGSGSGSDGASKQSNADSIEVLMGSLDEGKMSQFYKERRPDVSGAEVTHQSGIGNILPAHEINEALFEPCGYSMNGTNGRCYSTIHITPEPHCSYVSYEANEYCDSYNGVVDRCANAFRPARFSTILFLDDRNGKRKAFYPSVKGYVMRSQHKVTLPGMRVKFFSFDLRC